MAKDVSLDVQTRTELGRVALRKLNEQERIPAVIYGSDEPALSLSVGRREMIRLLTHHGAHAVVSLRIDDKSDQLALVKEVQVDAVRNRAIHIDFMRIREDRVVATEVPVEVVGESPAIKEGGILNLALRSLQIEALPRSIPDVIEVDVSELGMGDVIRVGDVAITEGVTILNDAEEVLVTIVAPSIDDEVHLEVEGEEVEGEEPAETEVAEGAEAAPGEAEKPDEN